MKTRALAQTCLQKKKGRRLETGEEPFWHLVKWKRENKAHKSTILQPKWLNVNL